MEAKDRVIVALDLNALQHVEELVNAVSPPATYFKIGSIPFTSMGYPVVDVVKNTGARVFLDLKWHDIPNTVAGAVTAATAMGVDMVNVHASGGKKMMAEAKKAAVDAAREIGQEPPIVIAVTVLTSFDDASYTEATSSSRPVPEQVVYLAKLAKEAGLDGVVASPKEISIIRDEIGSDFIIVTPGIRPAWASKGDQQRVMTPSEAIGLGADYVVIGRPIYASEDPAEAMNKVIEEIG